MKGSPWENFARVMGEKLPTGRRWWHGDLRWSALLNVKDNDRYSMVGGTFLTRFKLIAQAGGGKQVDFLPPLLLPLFSLDFQWKRIIYFRKWSRREREIETILHHVRIRAFLSFPSFASSKNHTLVLSLTTPLAQQGGSRGMFKYFSNTFPCLGTAFKITSGSNLLSDCHTLQMNRKRVAISHYLELITCLSGK